MDHYLYPEDSYEATRYRNSISIRSTKMETCARVFFRQFCLNGMFTLTKMIGYTQFMIYVIVRLIVCGSLAGRLFILDKDQVYCNHTKYYQAFNQTEEYETEVENTANLINPSSTEVENNCLTLAFHDSISPLYAWIITIFNPIVSWVCVIPWTPLSDSNQDSCSCPYTKTKWSCLTPYISTLLRTQIRLVLEITCFLWIIVEYEMNVPAQISCYDDTITCSVTYHEEMTCFLWILTVLNLISILLTIWEILHMCSHKEEYETDQELNDVFTFSRDFRSPTFSKKLDETKPLRCCKANKEKK